MAKEIQALGTTATTLYAQIIRATDGKIWNTSGTPAFENYSTANIADYDIAMTEAGTASGYFTGDFPSSITIGLYSIIVRQRAGGSPAESDIVVASGNIEWTGTVVNCISNADTNGRLDISKILGTAISTPATAGILDVNIKNINNVVAATPGAANGILIAGSNAPTTFAGSSSTAGLTITGGSSATGALVLTGGSSSGAGFYISTTSGDGISVNPTAGHAMTLVANGTTKHGINATGGSTTSHGIMATGGGVGHGIYALSGNGSTGDGIRVAAQSTNGNGLNLIGIGTGPGLLSTGGSTGYGIQAAGGGSSAGIRTVGGLTGPGMQILGGGTSGDGIVITAQASGHGINITATGTTKHGINSVGGATSSHGILASGGGTGHGISATGGSTGHGILSTGGATSGDGIRATATTSGMGLNCIGIGSTMPGIKGAGGTNTSAGMQLVGGATSGDGLLITTATSGHGINVTAAGTTKHGINAVGGAISSYGIAATGGGSGAGLFATGGSTGDGAQFLASASGHGLTVTGVGTTKHGINATGGNTTSHGIMATGGGVGHGIYALSGSGSTGDGIRAISQSTNGNGLNLAGTGSGSGFLTTTFTTSGTTTLNALTVSSATTLSGAVSLGSTLDITGTTTFAALTVTNRLSVLDGILVSCSTADRTALQLTGNGNGNAFACYISGSAPAVHFYNFGTGQGVRFESSTNAGLVLNGYTDDLELAHNDSGSWPIVQGYATGMTPLQPTVAGRTLDVSASGEAGIDWANIGSPTTAQDLSGTKVLVSSGTGAGQLDFLGSGILNTNVKYIDESRVAAQNQSAAAKVVYQGSVTGATTNTTLIDSGLNQSADDHWVGRIVIFLDGTLKYQATNITDFDAATDKITYAGLTSAPSLSGTYIIV